MRLLLATKNAGKVREFRAVLEPLPYRLQNLSDYPGLTSPAETESTFSGNARIKAEACFDKLGFPALADDSGLCVDALDGRPGVLSSRLAESDHLRIQELLRMLSDSETGGPVIRSAQFICALCLKLPDRCIEVEGRVEGRIVDVPRGSQGFGYDPVFFYPPLGRTFAELSREEKNGVSHRARALGALMLELPGGHSP